MLLLTFTAGANQYAVDVARIVELVPRVELRHVPHAPAFLAGLLGYRGRVVPVIDLGLLLDVAPCRDCLSTRIILVNDSRDDHNRWNQDRKGTRKDTAEAWVNLKSDLNLLGLIAEHVSDLTYVQLEQIVPAPVRLPQALYLGPLAQTDRGIIQLIVVEKVREATLESANLGQVATLELKPEPSSLTA